jgi:hypothetical protein
LLGYSGYGDIYEKIAEKKSTLKKPKCVKWLIVTILTVIEKSDFWRWCDHDFGQQFRK